MTLAEIKPMHGEWLYDRDGNLVGKWNGERGMFLDGFVVRERVCHFLPIQEVGFGCDLAASVQVQDEMRWTWQPKEQTGRAATCAR